MITSRVTLIRFTLRLVSAGGVTVPGRNRKDETDAVLDRDPWDRPHLPGTSLAGALRAECLRVQGTVWTDAVFGRLTEPGNPGPGVLTSGADEAGAEPADHGAASTVDSVPSRLWVLGTRLVMATGAVTEDAATANRTMTAIDRCRGAARVGTLRREELLLPESRFEAYLQWPEAEPAERTELLGVIAGWQPLIGRGVSRGRGLCAVEDLRWGELDLAEPDDLLTWVSGGGPDLVRTVAVRRPPVLDVAEPALNTVTKVTVRLAGPLLIGNDRHREQPRDDGETTKITEPLSEQGHFVVPGSALKGVLRSRAEYVLRSVVHELAACPDQRCGHCLPCRIFGHGGGDARGRSAVGLRGRLRVSDAAVRSVVTRDRTHVAINRFTGGAEPGLLYTDHVLEAGEFDLTIHAIGTLAPDEERAARCLLRLALNDLDDGLIGLGRGTTRGYGSLSLDLDDASGLPTTAEAQSWLTGYAAAYRPGEEVPA